jgi:hypothetical protein
MQQPAKFLWPLAAAAAVLLVTPSRLLHSSDNGALVPARLPKSEQANLLRFLREHEKPEHYFPPDAKLVAARPSAVDTSVDHAPGQPVKQYTVQIIEHRAVAGQEGPRRVDVYYYRPNPTAGKPGITVRHTVDLATGKQVGATEVLLNEHTPISREELREAVALAREKYAPVQELYKGRAANAVHWEYLQMLISRRHGPHEPGDRVARLVFTAPAAGNQAAPAPVPVVVNLTKGVVLKGE